MLPEEHIQQDLYRREASIETGSRGSAVWQVLHCTIQELGPRESAGVIQPYGWAWGPWAESRQSSDGYARLVPFWMTPAHTGEVGDGSPSLGVYTSFVQKYLHTYQQ